MTWVAARNFLAHGASGVHHRIDKGAVVDAGVAELPGVRNHLVWAPDPEPESPGDATAFQSDIAEEWFAAGLDSGAVAAVKAWVEAGVGEDRALRAAYALDAEEDREAPRKTLVAFLEAEADDGEE